MKDINYLPSAGHLPNIIDAFHPLLNELCFTPAFFNILLCTTTYKPIAPLLQFRPLLRNKKV